ncbi:MAG: cation:proton antiporter [Candidatus Atribacteria bacterium]|nr:cation:proton antiporter [Candidatus Atribacteria bacterium]
MRKIISILLLLVVMWGIVASLHEIPFKKSRADIADCYIQNGQVDTGASNIVTSVVVGYRNFDTLGEVTVLFLASIGLMVILSTLKKEDDRATQKASLILSTGCKFLFPLILSFGAYIFIHGHLTPGGGFQGGAVVASAFVLMYLGCHDTKRINEVGSIISESLGGLVFVVIGLIGLAIGTHFFLNNFMPKGEFNTLLSAGIIPIIYIAIGFKVGSELSKIIDVLMEES